MKYSRRIVFGFALVWALFLYYRAAYSIPLESSALATLMRWYGLTALALLFAALTPGLILVFKPTFFLNPLLLHARRAIGVSTFFFAFLHATIGFFNNLSGSFGVVFALPGYYKAALIFSSAALLILSVMALTSFNGMVRLLGGRRWKNLHRFVYIAAISILIHAFLIGSHFTNQDAFIPTLVKWFAGIFIMLEILATRKRLKRNPTSYTRFAVAGLVVLTILLVYTLLNIGGKGVFNIHREHIHGE